MIPRIINHIFTTDSLPVLGGATGALTQVAKLVPTLGAIISIIVLTTVGTIVGYLVKLLLDRIFKSKHE